MKQEGRVLQIGFHCPNCLGLVRAVSFFNSKCLECGDIIADNDLLWSNGGDLKLREQKIMTSVREDTALVGGKLEEETTEN